MAGQLVSPTFFMVSIRDTVVVDLVNKLPSTTTSIHWHGLCMHGGPVNGESNLLMVSIRDTMVVDLVNKLPSTTTSIHWHGLYMHGGLVNGESDLHQCEYKGQSGGGPREQAPLHHHLHPLAWALYAWGAS